MKKKVLTFACFAGLSAGLLLLTACGGGDQGAAGDDAADAAVETEEKSMKSDLSDAEVAEGWRLLFDGESLKGWRSFKQNELVGWSIEDGALTNIAEGGTDLVTDSGYKDFDLRFEWKVPEKGNSGVMFRVVESEDYGHPWETGPEYQLLDDHSQELQENLKPSQFAASNYDMEAPAQSLSKPTGEWNEGRLVVNGNHVEHWLNGVKVVEYELGSEAWKEQVRNSKWKDYPGYGQAPAGHIAFQGDHTKVWLRNIKIKEL